MAEKKYIDAEAAIEALESTDWYHQNKNKDMVHGANSSEHQAWYKEQDIYAAIRSIPAADVRPVVRCKDCRHRDPEDHKCDSGEMERQGCPFKVADDYFCAYGER